jgi:hypothetical protein
MQAPDPLLVRQNIQNWPISKPEYQKRQHAAEQARDKRIFTEMIEAKPYRSVAAASFASPPPIQPPASSPKPTISIKAPLARCREISAVVSPLAMARAMNKKVSAIETRLEIVIVKRSEKAAKTIKSGKNKSVGFRAWYLKFLTHFRAEVRWPRRARLRQIESDEWL